jgi:hypothetical protein
MESAIIIGEVVSPTKPVFLSTENLNNAILIKLKLQNNNFAEVEKQNNNEEKAT